MWESLRIFYKNESRFFFTSWEKYCVEFKIFKENRHVLAIWKYISNKTLCYYYHTPIKGRLFKCFLEWHSVTNVSKNHSKHSKANICSRNFLCFSRKHSFFFWFPPFQNMGLHVVPSSRKRDKGVNDVWELQIMLLSRWVKSPYAR